ncbi:TenA family protein [Marinilabilia rubra]|uniref:TenA family transcriptional regulator n=1 Tax=Marinilabilia rubra TaxID=2162893 RepID=A0A2U2BAZ1_9BACT|nr:TenA family protein [Marinilabilia rubra]PWE00231.1 TenA family transcriptional regulator [Marinilabilia rubra]
MKTLLQLNTPPAGPFTAQLWNENEALIERIFNHPFCRGLSNGSLPVESFKHYLQQDALYIEQDARAFAITAGKSKTRESFSFFLHMAKDGLEIERALHQNLMPAFKIEPAKKMSKACCNYTSFLLNTALNESSAISAAALLPCFWVYRETGLNIRQSSIINNPYQPWLDTYADDVYGEYVSKFINILECEMAGTNKTERQEMLRVFGHSIAYELDFFDEALAQSNY